MGLVLDILNGIRKQIAVADGVLKEAQDRRDLVAKTAKSKTDGTLDWFRSGSVAHGTVNKPVTDADGGLVLDRRFHTTLGPDGTGETPNKIVDEIEKLIEPVIQETYSKAKVSQHRRGLLVEFNEPLEEEQDPTVDLVVALNRKDDGLWIPDLDKSDWSPSHPEEHTNLFTSGSKERRALRARVIRLAKAWNKQWDEDDRALSSFNIEALVWEYVEDESVALDEALAGWFAYARDELEKGQTEDPAGVSEPIRLLKPKEAISRLGGAAERLRHALDNDDDEQTVRDDLAGVFRDFVEPPPDSKSAFAKALRTGEGVGASKTGLVTGVGAGSALKKNRSYGGERDG